MNDKNSYTNYSDSKKHNDTLCIVGNSDTFNILENNCDLKVDIIAKKHFGIRIWGQIKDCNNKPIPEALVKLIKPMLYNNKIEYKSLAHCISDDDGFYQFEIDSQEDDSAFKIIASKCINEDLSCNENQNNYNYFHHQGER